MEYYEKGEIDEQESIKQSQEIKELYNKIIALADENARFTLR
jgi:hypothetical protein